MKSIAAQFRAAAGSGTRVNRKEKMDFSVGWNEGGKVLGRGGHPHPGPLPSRERGKGTASGLCKKVSVTFLSAEKVSVTLLSAEKVSVTLLRHLFECRKGVRHLFC